MLPYCRRVRVEGTCRHDLRDDERDPFAFQEDAMRAPFLVCLAALAAAVLVRGALAAEPVTLTVYTSLEKEHLDKYAQRFYEAHPQIRIEWLRETTGVLTDRILAEKAARQADVIWGLAATSLLLLKRESLLHAYAPAGIERLDPRFSDHDDPPGWVGMDAWVTALCVNTVELEFRKLVPPTTWKELLDPAYQGLLAMPDPAASGTGFMTVSGWLQLFGEERGWAYMDALHRSIRSYTRSGSRPCVQAARGEVAVGISFAYRAASMRANGAPIEIAVPQEGVGWDMEAAAIVAGTAHLAQAKTLLDWIVGSQANRLYNEHYAVIAMPSVATPVARFPENTMAAMIRNDFDWAAENRARILEQWRERYGAKSEPAKEPEK
jgi:iron(III) transport system substrate-binding protein